MNQVQPNQGPPGQAPPGQEAAGDHRVALPSRIGRYTILDRIGSGGMGDVYRAYDPDLQRAVALKVFRAPDSTDTVEHTRTTARKLMLVEAQSMAKLSHPNIVPIFDVGTLNDGIFLAMEFVAGKTLRTWIEQEKRDWRQALRLVCQAARGLQAVHQAGMVHCDIKPENIMIGDDGVVRILDFGLAGIKDQVEAQASGQPIELPADSLNNDTITTTFTRVSKSISGTPGYLAPEQFQGIKANPKSDQFSIAVVLFESIYGQRPFSSTDVFQAKKAEDLEIRFPRGGPRWLRSLIMRSLAFTPEERYPHLGLLLDQIDAKMASRKHFTASLVSLCVLTGSGIHFGLPDSPNHAPCTSVSEKTKGIWDNDQRIVAKSAFLASGHKFAADTWGKVSSRLVHYREQWAESYDEICQQNQNSDHIQSLNLDHRMRCLDRRLRQLELLSEVFANATPSVVEQATAASLKLASPHECIEADANDEQYPLPQNPRQQNEIFRIQQQLDSVGSLIVAGSLDQAAQVALKSIEQARRLQYPPLLIDAISSYALVLESQWRISEAAPLQREALALAISINDSERATFVVGKLLHSLSLTKSNRKELADWISLATATNDRLQSSSKYRASLYNSIGNIYFNSQEISLAKSAYLEGLESPEISDEARASLQMNVAQCELHEGRNDDSQRNLLQGLKTFREIFGDQHPRLSHPTAILGQLALDDGRARKSLDLMNRAIALATDSRGQVGQRALPAYYSRGHALHQLGYAAEAIDNAQIHLDSDTRLTGPDHPRLCVDYFQLAKFEGMFGNFEGERQTLLKLEELAARLHGNQLCTHSALWSRAYYHLRRDHLEAARAQLELARSLLQESMASRFPDAPESRMDSRTRRMIENFNAELLLASGELEQAKIKFENIVDESQNAEQRIPINSIESLLHVATIARKQENWNVAHSRIDQAEALIIAMDSQESRRLADIDLHRGQIELDKNQWRAARKRFQDAHSRLDERSSSPLLLAEVELNWARASYPLAVHRNEASQLAKNARDRLIGRLPIAHPRVAEIEHFLKSCCSSD